MRAASGAAGYGRGRSGGEGGENIVSRDSCLATGVGIGGFPIQMDDRELMTASDDEIQEKYLERAIRELNDLNRRIADAPGCVVGGHTPVLGSGHPIADIFLLKHGPAPAEIEEGVAFYGRAGNALMKSFKRLNIDPMVVYGTICAKCPGDADLDIHAGHVGEEIQIVQPRIIVAMGRQALHTLNEIKVPLSMPVNPELGEIAKLTATIDVLHTPDIDQSLDSDDSKRAFWGSFRKLGDWYEALPPY